MGFFEFTINIMEAAFMKKLSCITLASMLSVASILSLASCNKNKTTDPSAKDNFSVGLVTDTAGMNDESFNQSAWEGMTKVKKNLGFNIQYVESKQESEYGPNLDKLTDANLDAIFAVGYRMASALEHAAETNPDQYYVMLDYRYKDALPNTLSIEFRDQESSFLVGYIAGQMTKTNKLGFISGGTGEVIDRFEYGFKGGVAYAAKELGKNITVDSQCAESFQDDAKGKAMATAMYSKDIDIIFHAAGNVGKGIIEAAKENKKYAIGVDSDQSYLAPENVISSAMKFVGGAVESVCADIKKGIHPGGESRSVGLKEGGVGISSTTSNIVPQDILDKTQNLQQQIIDEKVVPPYNQSSLEEFAATLK